MKPRFVLQKAKKAFLSKKYDIAMKLFNEIVIINPDNKEAKLGILLCDMANDNEEQAQKIFDYYQLTKIQKVANAEDGILNLINILDKNTNYFVSLLNKYEEAQINDIDGILYSDFKKLLDDKNDFKKIFEYAMFSTKIIFTKKSDFYEFLNLLIDNGLSNISMQYIENLSSDITSDNEMQKIIKKALKANEN
ncbi:tetratricopeptide repeat protein [Helicobacter sp. MIT 99-5507]|uniref:tetratricopeptide repeat protein n=1 Tax=Helicobacter sp. MIT 99-5507 TaxID=152489 RepID=UPI000E1F220E|nr:tetratricopeptide repeat protein [Helicobacter sp. MIT 99-5507]RDU57365.1 hypothetical protein CQA42_05355 [Helicobacter sp. MIT 99-5507]